jgi:hypothetical protein
MAAAVSTAEAPGAVTVNQKNQKKKGARISKTSRGYPMPMPMPKHFFL